jgi:hypothetical protein
MILRLKNDERAVLAEFMSKETGLRAFVQCGVTWLTLSGQKNNLAASQNTCVTPK